ncbi:hypothetical protein HDA32_006020 [Spinactinospora alkalitolerans]|uniref:DUF3618 domain-containing protein n=1 Tax=Spinactinospora alkalitolerans TaxID=687207 RepID=A0A852UAA4_9ACTN|nr:DUF3618 domain-containing protein [Spinactinospora alkalitolerans]NYE50900.1 hypothetical protein [Spinactinospora alkalitolerans]
MTQNVSGSQEGRGKQPQEDPDLLRAEIDRTRAELGDTVEALAAKADVKSRAKEGAARAVDSVRTSASEPMTEGRRIAVSVAAGALLAAAAAVVTAKRGRR